MVSRSHKSLGKHLIRRYLYNCSTLDKNSFLLGCVQPDKNPTTYLKGSIRHTPFRGHNWYNAKNYMVRTATALAASGLNQFYDYYRLGKLIHYLADAFTFPHNRVFSGDLNTHRAYEKHLHIALIQQINANDTQTPLQDNLCKYILSAHSTYLLPPHNPEKDASYILRICCATMDMLTAPKFPTVSERQLHEFCS